MLFEGYIINKCPNIKLFEIKSIREFNEQIADNITRDIEILEKELISLTDLLIIDGNLLNVN